MSEVFQPLEVWNRDASGVDVDVWQYQHLTHSNEHGISINRGHVLQFVSQHTTDPQRFWTNFHKTVASNKEQAVRQRRHLCVQVCELIIHSTGYTTVTFCARWTLASAFKFHMWFLLWYVWLIFLHSSLPSSVLTPMVGQQKGNLVCKRLAQTGLFWTTQPSLA